MVVLSNGVLKQLKTMYNILKCYKIDFNTIVKFVSCMPTYDLVSCPAMYIHYEMCAKGFTFTALLTTYCYHYYYN